MFAPKFLAVFLFAAIVIEGASESTLNGPKRSERWDKYIQDLKDAHEERRVRRQLGAGEWHSNRANCNPAEYTTRDTIGRRASDILATPQNQGSCGSCWAFASVNTLTDQLSITQGSSQSLLSAGYLTSCLKDRFLVANGNGCCGGFLHAGPKFFRDNGAVTATCSPYSSNTRKKNLPTCPRACSDGSPLSLSSYRTMGYERLNSEQEIITALNAGNVVLVSMSVTTEFFTYECGVYQDSGTTDVIGGHAVEIVDYGATASGTSFWVAKNSWGTTVQENGYFRIKRGQLRIGANGQALRLVVGSNAQDATNISTCTETPVSNPASDEMIMSAIEFAEQQLLAMNLISCIGDARATGLTRESIMTAGAQVIAGTRIDIELTANVMGCSKTTKADITASVIIDLDGNFRLNTQNVNTRSSGAKDLAAYWWLWLLLAALATAFTQM